MTSIKGGPLMPVKIVTDAELEENGGLYRIRGRVAWRAREFDGDERAVEGGAVTPVYPVTLAQVESGQFKIKGVAAMPLTSVTTRPIKGRVATPVFFS